MSASAHSKQVFVALVLGLSGCGGGAATSPPADAPAPPPAEPAPAPASAATATSPAPSAAPPAPAAETAPAAEPAAESEPSDAPRDVKFIQTPEGLRVEMMGVKFVPKVDTVRTPAGFAVKVTINATASESRSLLAPKNGALAFAGVVKRAKGEPETFGDDREGDGDQPLGAGTTVKLTREWPGKLKVRPLSNGDVLELDIALWGLGTATTDRRAVKQFLRVKAKVEQWKASARIEVPPSVKGKK